jgi:hypothetical protein
MSNCFVRSCTNSTFKCKSRGEKVTFYHFPKDRALRETWIRNCGQDQNLLPKSHHRVCSSHFLSTEVRGLSGIRQLVSNDAIPSVNLGNYISPGPTCTDLRILLLNQDYNLPAITLCIHIEICLK